nr:MAG TPA: hypothetical protein [Caudoviricetes sp.]
MVFLLSILLFIDNFMVTELFFVNFFSKIALTVLSHATLEENP